MVPETRQIELTVGRLDACGNCCTYIIIGCSIGTDGEGKNFAIAVVRQLLTDTQWQCLTLRSLQFIALSMQTNNFCRITWLLDAYLRLNIKRRRC